MKVICTMDCGGSMDHNHIRVLPDTCIELFLNYTNTPVATIGGKLHRGSIVTFRTNQFMDVQMRKGTGCLAVCFYPGMAYQFFKLPMQVLSNQVIALSDLWRDKTWELEDTLSNEGDPNRRIDLLQQTLIRMLTPDKDVPLISQCIKTIQLAKSSFSPDQLSGQIGLSRRQISRKFQLHIGMAPGEYLRISRFISSLKVLRESSSGSLTEVAYQSGYYDQAHFIRDYKHYTGHTPREVASAKNIF